MIASGRVKADSNKIIWTSDPLPNDAITLPRTASKELSGAVQNILSSISQDDAKSLLPNRYTGFVPATHESGYSRFVAWDLSRRRCERGVQPASGSFRPRVRGSHRRPSRRSCCGGYPDRRVRRGGGRAALSRRGDRAKHMIGRHIDIANGSATGNRVRAESRLSTAAITPGGPLHPHIGRT